jgi:ATP/maltotriose-dependent transcriptional regulator MalT
VVDSLGQAVVAVETPLLQTKLYIPRSRTSVVPRPRLNGRLTHGAEGKLTLVSAPAGFGKTTLLTESRHEKSRSCASLRPECGTRQSPISW